MNTLLVGSRDQEEVQPGEVPAGRRLAGGIKGPGSCILPPQIGRWKVEDPAGGIFCGIDHSRPNICSSLNISSRGREEAWAVEDEG